MRTCYGVPELPISGSFMRLPNTVMTSTLCYGRAIHGGRNGSPTFHAMAHDMKEKISKRKGSKKTRESVSLLRTENE